MQRRHLLLLSLILSSAYAIPITPLEKFELVVEEEIYTFIRGTLKEGAELLQRILDNAELLDPCEADRVVLARFSEFVARTKHTVDSEELEDLLEELEELLDLEDVSRELDDSESVLGKLLRQFGFETFERNVERQMETFMQRTEYHIETYLKRKNVHDPEIASWLHKFKLETDVETKYLLLGQLFQILALE